MYVLQTLLLLLPISLYILQLCQCSPTFFEGYRKKQKKIREIRLKKSAAKTRLNDLTNKYRRRIESKKNSLNNQITTFHTTRSEWIKKDIEHTQVEAKVRRHKLAATVFKSIPEMNDIFNHQAKNLQKESKEIQKQKSEIKDKGYNDFASFQTYRKNYKEDKKAFDEFKRKTDDCIDKIPECTPVHFQEYRKKQQKIREVRLKKSTAEARLEAIERKYDRHVRSAENANYEQVGRDHSNREKWIKKDRQHVKVEASMKRHKVIAKSFKNDKEISDIFHNQAKEIQAKSNKLQEQKDTLKRKGFNADFIGIMNSHIEEERYRTYEEKMDRCQSKIRKHSDYLAIHDKIRCKIL